jgi:molybdate transport system regulatory protein
MKVNENREDEMKLKDIIGSLALGIRSKVWIELDGKPFLGEGRYNVLSAIERYGSLKNAAEETKVSYRRVRGMISDMEKTSGCKLVVTERGGREGGGAALTELANELLSCFRKQMHGVNTAIDSAFQRIFYKDI